MCGQRRRHSPVPLDRAGQVQRTSSWSFCCSWTSFVRQSPTEAAVTATGHHHCWANSVLITSSGQLAIQGGRSLRSITALLLVCKKTTLWPKYDTYVWCYSFDMHQTILIIFGRNVTDRAGSQILVYFPTSPNYCLCTTRGNKKPENCDFLLKQCIFCFINKHKYANPSHRSLLFQDWLHGFPGLFTDTSEHTRFFTF